MGLGGLAVMIFNRFNCWFSYLLNIFIYLMCYFLVRLHLQKCKLYVLPGPRYLRWKPWLIKPALICIFHFLLSFRTYSMMSALFFFVFCNQCLGYRNLRVIDGSCFISNWRTIALRGRTSCGQLSALVAKEIPDGGHPREPVRILKAFTGPRSPELSCWILHIY